MTNLTIDYTDAEFEIERRAKGGHKAGHTVPPTPQAEACSKMSGADLRALAAKGAKKSAPKVRKARPTGVGSRGGDPDKARRMDLARKTAAKQGIVPFQGDREATAKFWAIYSATK